MTGGPLARARTATKAPWLAAANCRGIDPELFFSDPDEHGGQSTYTLVRVVCMACPVRRECLDDALANDGPRPLGFAGGLSPSERYFEARRRRAEA